MNKILSIEGMHRSGTSLITQWLYKCGLHVGEHLLKPNVGNVEGHFEDIDFIKLHEEYLEAADLPETGLTDKKPVPVSNYRKEKMHAIINLKNNLNQQWGWKDPRTVLFLDIYRDLIPDAYHLIITRSYTAVVSSLLTRDAKYLDVKHADRKPFDKWIWQNFKSERRKKALYKRDAEFYLKVWISYNEEVLKQVQLLPKEQYMVVDYMYILNNNREVFEHLTHEWEFDLHYKNFGKIYKQNLLSKVLNIEQYISDRSLLERARQLEAAINEYHFTNIVDITPVMVNASQMKA